VFIAECKIWEGKKRFSEGVDQLLGYLTWRDTKAAMIALLYERKGGDGDRVKALETLREQCLFVKDADPIEGDPVVILHHQGDEQRSAADGLDRSRDAGNWPGLISDRDPAISESAERIQGRRG